MAKAAYYLFIGYANVLGRAQGDQSESGDIY